MALPIDNPARGIILSEPFPPTVIRVETVLCKYPVHRLTKQSSAGIQIFENNREEPIWKVSPNQDYGEPGPLAYKLETLVINRRIDEARCPNVPEVIRLGSLKDIAQMLKLGGDTNKIKQALLQNASVFIAASLSHLERDNVRRQLDIGGTRFDVVFTGENFSDGSIADSVYVVLSKWYMDILNRVHTRPLDYDYLQILPPSAQRFYEIISFQIYAALKHKHTRARLLYSDFCQIAPLTRNSTFKRVHMQMKEIHAPHLASGYLEKVQYKEISTKGKPLDWEFFYTPGPRAKAEKARSDRGEEIPRLVTRSEIRCIEYAPSVPPPIQASQSAASSQSAPKPAPAAPKPAPAALDAAAQALADLLVAQGMGQSAAKKCALEHPEECRRQLEYLPYVGEIKVTHGAYLRRAIEDCYGAPKGYAEAKKAEAEQAASTARAARANARKSHFEAYGSAYSAFLGLVLAQMENDAPAANSEAYAEFCAQEKKDYDFWAHSEFSKTARARQRIASFHEPEERLRRFRSYVEKQEKDGQPLPGVPHFWAWDQAHNPDGFQD